MPTPLLLFKYDEAASGTSPTAVTDTSAGTALNAPLTYAGSSWTSIAAGRGLSLAGGVANGGLTATLGGTKVATALTGATKASMLVVVDTTLAAAGGANVSGIINNSSGDQPFEIEVSSSGTQIKPYWNNAVVGIASITAGLHVIEVVVDTTRTVAADRVIVYVDGAVVAMSATTFPALNTAIDAFGAAWASWRYAMGIYGGGNGLHGVLYSNALYATANTAAEAAAHSTALLSNNDANPDAAAAPVLSRRRPVSWPDDVQEVVQRRAKLVKDGTVQADTVLRTRRPQAWAWQEPEPWQTARRALLVPSAPAAADQVPCHADALLLSWEPEAWPERRRTLLVPATPVATADTVLRARGQASPWWDQVDQVAQRRPRLVPAAAVVDVVLVRRRAFGQDWDQVEAWPIQRRPDFVSQAIVVANTVLFRRRWLASVLEQWPTDWTVPRRRLSPPMPEETRLRPPLTSAVDSVRLSVRVDSVELTVSVDPVRLSTGERLDARKTTDTYPITTTLLSNGAAVPLGGYTVTINIVDRPSGAVKRANGSCTITDAANGRVSYQPTSGDVDTAGSYYVEWKAVSGGGVPYHFPSKGYDPLEVQAALG